MTSALRLTAARLRVLRAAAGGDMVRVWIPEARRFITWLDGVEVTRQCQYLVDAGLIRPDLDRRLRFTTPWATTKLGDMALEGRAS